MGIFGKLERLVGLKKKRHTKRKTKRKATAKHKRTARTAKGRFKKKR